MPVHDYNGRRFLCEVTQLEFRKLGNLDVSPIGLGTLRTVNVTSDEDIAVRRAIVDNCLTNDINFIDSAAAYGNS
jgi:aryl-alcohol dehydrogenase-like predicted oxidoreductase